ncbi:MAG: Gfo/Idh/MocA family oxidoreductase [Lentisphaeria bacterium]|nr:Gfo/Idh/MocA family oxidoreductase [Lentisphaeria bacterium]
MAKVRYAVIGFGGIAENRVAKEGFACDKTRFAPLQYAELIGAFDLNPARKAAAAALGLKWYKSVDDLLADKKIDAVYVATNNATHAPMTIKALEAGKHVIVEKPIATSITDAKKMIATAKRKKLSLSVDHMMVNNAFNRMAKKGIAAGKLGTVNDCCFHMEFAYGYDPAEAATWRCSKVEEMGGPIGDVASHCFYVAEYVFGSPIVEVAAVYLPKLMEIKAEDGAYIKFTMANGLKGSVKVAFSELRGGLIGTLSNLGFEIYGSEGVLRSFGSMFQLSGHGDEPYKMRLELETASGVKNLRPRIFPNIYQTLIEDHAKSVLSGRRLTGENGLHNLELCAASHKSAKSGGKAIRLK